MKTKVILGSITVAALAGGVMFCGDEEILTNEAPTDDRVVDDTQREVPEGKGPLVTLHLGAAGTTTPSFWAVRIGETWSQPPEYAGKVKFRLDGNKYAVAWACEAGQDVHTTLVEATAAELPELKARCASEDTTKPVEVTGAIRNVNGTSPTLLVGTSSQPVENEKGARDVLFSTMVPEGTHAFVAQIGDSEKAKFATARGVEVKEGVNVEIDGSEASTLQSKTWEIKTDASTQTRFGDAAVWIDGRTRVHQGKLQVEDYGVTTRHMADGTDYVDIRADLHGAPKDSRAGVRYLVRANREAALPMPALNWVGPSYARIENGNVNVSWSRRNWAVLGRVGADLALFMPIAYVATITQTEPNFRFDLVVTPSRAIGKTPHFKVPKLRDIENWEDRFWFDQDKKLAVRAGNLTAHAGDVAPSAANAIAAYLDSDFAPADLGVDEILAVVLAGAANVNMGSEGSIEDAIETRCVDFYGCEPNEKPGPPVPGSAAEVAKSVSACPDLEAWADCEIIEQLPERPPFAAHLQREIARWYQSGATIPNAVELDTALQAATPDSAKPVAVPEGFNLEVFSHADPTRADSATTWVGAYLDGRLVSLQPINWDAKFE